MNTSTMVVCPPCFVCGNSATVELSQTEIDSLDAGMFVQDALPSSEAAFRELFVSGTHEHCWLTMFEPDAEV